MADSPSYPGGNRSARMKPNRRPATGIPRWVMVFLITFIVLVLLFVILHLTGNGFGSHIHMSAIQNGTQQL